MSSQVRKCMCTPGEAVSEKKTEKPGALIRETSIALTLLGRAAELGGQGAGLQTHYLTEGVWSQWVQSTSQGTWTVKGTDRQVVCDVLVVLGLCVRGVLGASAG